MLPGPMLCLVLKHTPEEGRTGRKVETPWMPGWGGGVTRTGLELRVLEEMVKAPSDEGGNWRGGAGIIEA